MIVYHGDVKGKVLDDPIFFALEYRYAEDYSYNRETKEYGKVGEYEIDDSNLLDARTEGEMEDLLDMIVEARQEEIERDYFGDEQEFREEWRGLYDYEIIREHIDVIEDAGYAGILFHDLTLDNKRFEALRVIDRAIILKKIREYHRGEVILPEDAEKYCK